MNLGPATPRRLVLVGAAAAALFGVAVGGYELAPSQAPPSARLALTSSTPAVTLSPAGNDTTCSRGGSPCSSFDRADRIAQSGHTIQVAPGTYTGPVNYGYADTILTSTPVTFVCAAGAPADSVTFSDAGFLIGPGGGNVTFTGSCFHFHILAIGLRGYSGGTNRVHDITVNGAHTDSFDITGALNILVENSQVGPIDACFANAAQAASFGAPASAACDPANPIEAYWATASGTLGLQDEPFVHNNGSDPAQDVHFVSDHFTGMQTKWPAVFHQGGLLIWSTSGTQIIDSTFDHNAIYNIEFNAGTSETAGLWKGDTFAAAVYTLADGANAGLPLPARQCQEGAQDASSSWTGSVFTDNTFEQCFNIGAAGAYSGVQFTNNQIGPYANCAPNAGITYSGNVSGGKPVCGGAPPTTSTTTTTSTPSTTTVPPPPLLGLRISVITVQWTPAPGATSYRLYRDGTLVSTAGAKATSARFSLTAGIHTITVSAVGAPNTQTLTITSR